MMATALTQKKRKKKAKNKCIKQKYLLVYHIKPKLTANAVQIILANTREPPLISA